MLCGRCGDRRCHVDQFILAGRRLVEVFATDLHKLDYSRPCVVHLNPSGVRWYLFQASIRMDVDIRLRMTVMTERMFSIVVSS